MSEESELTFADIYQEILSQGKFSIEVPDAYAPIARQGVKNCKAYWNKKSKKQGFPQMTQPCRSRKNPCKTVTRR
jgi:hypothetical protein